MGLNRVENEEKLIKNAIYCDKGCTLCLPACPIPESCCCALRPPPPLPPPLPLSLCQSSSGVANEDNAMQSGGLCGERGENQWRFSFWVGPSEVPWRPCGGLP